MNMNAVFKFALVMSAIPLLTAQKVEKFPLRSLAGLEPQLLEAESVHYRGRDAIHLSATPKTKGEPIVILTNSDFENGTIELDVAGAPPAGASDSARGSVGIAFHLQSPTRFECFYLRMTNARADDQARVLGASDGLAEPLRGCAGAGLEERHDQRDSVATLHLSRVFGL